MQNGDFMFDDDGDGDDNKDDNDKNVIIIGNLAFLLLALVLLSEHSKRLSELLYAFFFPCSIIHVI